MTAEKPASVDKTKEHADEELPADVVEWQKKQVQRGLQDADQGRFASQEKVKKTIRKFVGDA